jgi:monoamine oxidase
MSIAIIGGGITGLTAAFRLRRAGVPVTLYEASNRVGGVIQTTCRDGFLAECGPNTILETSPIVNELVRDLRLESQRLYSDPPQRIATSFAAEYRRQYRIQRWACSPAVCFPRARSCAFWLNPSSAARRLSWKKVSLNLCCAGLVASSSTTPSIR